MEPEQHFLVSRPGPQLSRLALPPVHLLLAPGLAAVETLRTYLISVMSGFKRPGPP